MSVDVAKLREELRANKNRHLYGYELTALLDAAERERDEARKILRDAYVGLAFAFNRLHGSARSRDTELCSDFEKIRAAIEATGALKDRQP